MNKLIHIPYPSAMAIHNKARNDVAVSLGYRSYSHLRTEGKEDLALCESETSFVLANKLHDLKFYFDE